MKIIIFLFAVLFLLSPSFVFADIIHVPDDTSGIQGGIDLANPGDTVLVAEGRYIENPEIKNKHVILASHFILDGDTSHISKTIIDGSQPAVTDSATTVLIRFNPDFTPVLCGFTITGGYGTVVSDGGRAAGGIAVIGSNAIIEHNIISGNMIDYDSVPGDCPGGAGGGIYVFPLFYNNIDVTIRDNIIKNNKLEGYNKSGGGGLLITNAAGQKNFGFLVERNTFEDNRVINHDDWKAMGGGVEVDLAIPNSGEQIIRNNMIRRNHVECEHSFGGGIYVVFVENKAGGNLDTSPGTFIYNNIIIDNHSDYSGGGVAFFRIYKPTPWSQPEPLTSKGHYTPRPAFINNTIVSNTAPDGAGIFTMNHIPFFMNNILWNNQEPENEWGEIYMGNVDRWIEDNRYAGIEIHYSDIQGGWDGEGNIDQNPYFEDSLHNLSDSSCCVGNGIDSLEVEGMCYSCPLTDYNGNMRPHSIDDLVDIGAIESAYKQVQVPVGIEGLIHDVPIMFELSQNYPNPFNPSTTIRFSIPKSSHVVIDLFNTLGQKVATIVDRDFEAGSHKLKFESDRLAGGLYIYQIKAGTLIKTRKMLYLK